MAIAFRATFITETGDTMMIERPHVMVQFSQNGKLLDEWEQYVLFGEDDDEVEDAVCCFYESDSLKAISSHINRLFPKNTDLVVINA